MMPAGTNHRVARTSRPASGADRYDGGYYASLDERWTRLSQPVITPRVLRALRQFRPARILDLGCGAGAYATALSSSGAAVDGCDVSPAALTASSGRYAHTFLAASTADLPSNAYDMVFCSEVIEHVDLYRPALRDIHRALRPGGILLLTTTLYGPTVFAMLYQVKAARFAALRAAGGCIDWLRGYTSEQRRDRFVRRWCTESTGGHVHGFLAAPLTRSLRAAGFSIRERAVFYALMPLQMPFLYSTDPRKVLLRREWPLPKRLLAAVVLLASYPVNRAFRRLGWLANNGCWLAQKP